MSYSLPMRVLETLHRKASDNLFHENVANVLASNVALDRKQRIMNAMEGAPPSLQSMEGPWRELACLDLSPTGLFFSQTRKYAGITEIWNAYSTYTDVLDPSVCQEQGIHPTKSISKVHFRLLEGYGTFFDHCLNQNRRNPYPPSVRHGFTLKDVARIFNAPMLLQDACDFFLTFPRSKVSDLYTALGLHPRTGERRFAAEGISALAIKRACAISSASRYILWSDMTLAEIAAKCGYTDGAHLHHEFRRSTGGIPPAAYRRAVHVQH